MLHNARRGRDALRDGLMSSIAVVAAVIFITCSTTSFRSSFSRVSGLKNRRVTRGTNNLRKDDGKSVADGIISLAQSIQRQCPDIEIVVSGIISRSDDVSASSKVRETNELVKTMCNQYDWNFIPNTNIKSKHLNARGLHLNRSGSLLLQNNFKLAIKN